MNQNDIIQQMMELRSNPIAMQKKILKSLEDLSGGAYKVMDPTNPFTFLTEAAVSIGSASMLMSESLVRKQYPTLAMTDDDVYRHMSDIDYINRFSSPSKVNMTLMIDKDEVYAKAIPVDGSSSVKMLVLPRNSTFEIDATEFTMLYPIEIKILPHDGLRITYNNDRPSPIQPLETNAVDWRLVNYKGQEFIEINTRVNQLTIQPYFTEILNSSKFVNTYSFDDLYYYTRVYVSQTDGSWAEIKTTHSDQIYDKQTITAVLKVMDGKVQVSIPSIYFNMGIVNRELRIDVYSTKGVLNKDLSLFNIEEYSAKWIDNELVDAGLDKYSAPINTITDIIVYSSDTCTGGTAAISFEELRRRVVESGSGRPIIPITPSQLSIRLRDSGYNVVAAIDNITDRVLQASRSLPAPTTGDTVTGAGAMMFDLVTTIEKLSSSDGVVMNGERFTFKPTIIYRVLNGVLNIVPTNEVNTIKSLPSDILATTVNADNLHYSPWHYVVDTTQNRMEVRAYHLTNPKVISRNFVNENTNSPKSVGIKTVLVEATDHGFIIEVETNSSKDFKDLEDDKIQVQLSFLPVGETSRAYQPGILVVDTAGAPVLSDVGERTYRWDITTNFDITDESEITLTSFSMMGDSSLRLLKSELLSKFEIVFIALDTDTDVTVDESLQQSVDTHVLPTDTASFIAIVKEGFNIEFGTALTNLWTRSRTTITGASYKTYEADVLRYHTETVYETDPITGELVILYNEDTGLAEVNVLHNIGDPYTANGKQIYLHKKGDLVYDDRNYAVDYELVTNTLIDMFGKTPSEAIQTQIDELRVKIDDIKKAIVKHVPIRDPRLDSSRDLSRILSIMLIDGRYAFSTDPKTVAYRDNLADTLTDWMENDIQAISGELLEKTEIYYYPQKTTGLINVYDADDLLITIDSEQRLTVKLMVPASVYGNTDLRSDISKKVISTIDTELMKSTITSSNIITSLVSVLGDDVLGVVLTGLGGAKEVSTMTVESGNSRPVIGKKLHVTADGLLSVIDDLTVIFILHRS